MKKNFLGRNRHNVLVSFLVLTLSLTLLSCSSPRPPSAASDTLGTFTFGTPTPPLTLDPAVTTDIESLRVSRQIMEPLIFLDRINGEPKPGLALSWSQSENQLETTFVLRPSIKFHDGTPFDSSAVCANFNRWQNLPPNLRDHDLGNQFKAIFQPPTAKKKKTGIYHSCLAPTPTTVTIVLTRSYQPLIKALGQPGFAIASPKALAEKEANAARNTSNGAFRSRFGEHPVGTGPYSMSSWSDNEITLTRNDDYWGKKSNAYLVKFKTIDTMHARVEALVAGEVDAVDNLSAEQYDVLRKRTNRGTRVLPRDPYSVLLLNINQKYRPLGDPLIRQAISQALERNTIVSNGYIYGTPAAYQFLPPRLTTFGDTTGMPAYNPDEAKKLLAKSSYAGEPIPFYYPVKTSETSLPEPERTFADIAQQLTAIGLNIKPVPIEWSQDYRNKIQDNEHGFSLSSIHGMYRDPDAFVGTLLSEAVATAHYTNPKAAELLAAARQSAREDERTELYKKIQGVFDKDLPIIPIAFPISAVATGSRVVSYPISPIMDETLNSVMLK